jgi:hypothetical protein
LRSKFSLACVCFLLYAAYFLILTVVRIAANSQHVLLMEEASTSFVNVAFFSMGLQHDPVATSIGAYWIFWLGSWLPSPPDLFYGRAVKVIFVASVPMWIFLLLHLRFQMGRLAAVATSLGIGLLPGILSYGWYALDTSLDLPFALAALFFAMGQSSWNIVLSGLLLGQALLTYGESLIFVPAISIVWLHHFRGGRALAALGAVLASLAPLVAAVLWWRNVQTLILGGGASVHYPMWHIFKSVALDFAKHNVSYYFFSNGRPAMGSIWIAGLAAIATIVAVLKWRKRWIWLSILASGAVVMLVSGGPPGVRRLLPVVIALGVITGFLFVEMDSRFRLSVRSIGLVLILYLAFGAYRYWDDLRAQRLQIPRDFRFENLPGLNMAESLHAMAEGKAPAPTDFRVYDPQRTLGVLYLMSRPHPVVDQDALLRYFEPDAPPLDASEPRFGRLLP